MTRKFLLINCDPATMEWLGDQLGADVHLMPCASIDEVSQRMAQEPGQAVMAYQSNGRIAPINGVAVNGYALITAAHVNGNGNGNGHHGSAESTDEAGRLSDQVDRFEQLVIERTLARHGNHRKDTAAELGISRVTLYNKMKKFGMLTDE